MTVTHDYVVIGAGHNGLVAATTLAQAGSDVLVVERLPHIGGLTTSLPRVPEAPGHLLHVGAMDDMFMAGTSLADDLGIAKHGYRSIALDRPYGWMADDGATLILHREIARTLEEIRYFSRRDARTYEEVSPVLDFLIGLQVELGSQRPSDLSKKQLLRIVGKLGLDKRARSFLVKMLTMSIFELVSETFDSDAMRGLCAYWCSMFGPASLDGSGVYLAGFAAVHRGRGVLRARGGMSAIAEALASSIRSAGGDIKTGSGVEQILVEGNRAVGVRLEDGTEVRARRGVLGACAPQHTLGTLLDDAVLDANTKIQVTMMPANSADVALFKIDVALGGRAGYPKAQALRDKRDGIDLRTTTWMTGTLEDHVNQFQQITHGHNVTADPPVYMAILSASDPTLAPDGQDVLYTLTNCAARPAAGWEAEKAGYSKVMTASLERFLSGFETEIGRVEHSPADLESVFNIPNACFFHVDMTATRLGSNRPAAGLGGYRTPVDGLFLAGSGVHPGGGVNGWPGRLAAQFALEDF
ncbi:FAD-dependent oxidoreductase [Mycolicibacterium moriokaense]|uniref:Pyridine nucleotide-disulfide oxidoreductase domain-containing protein 2 n=1 Tax=Mycolicibacterium moriokaense TaxID=39691 RepID=A0AAD1H8F3_9MYCO|nr:NAD(P)/FAD-dependent oxidoreductase [Mycolicibacterium moriokaense]MCV7039190.1 NAD(P)/FAD-dependent oxidoreductase [Mycolicibacterium moriokaense]ORB18528.1 FAD-dependent oxidoreductase [Mycolicibacterium moriokaense]BBX00095.1 beta-carotene ketolase [Mycolicibacterium moriokaense]